MTARVLVGDCRDVLAGYEPETFHAVVCDPPYELNFMGRGWDNAGVSFEPETWRAVWRVLKPGGYLLAFSGTRTSHRMVCAIEDAGFEIRDTLSWLYGSGFPKSLNVSAAIDKAAGAEREVVGHRTRGINRPEVVDQSGGVSYRYGRDIQDSAPTTDAAREWDGWGTALKPAHEPIIVARKPLSEKTVAANVLAHGVGAINVDACRVGSESTRIPRPAGSLGRMNDDGWQPKPGFNGSDKGRWPPNVAMDEDAARLLDQMSGVRTSGMPVGMRNKVSPTFPHPTGTGVPLTGYGDTGGASRFMYVAKAAKSERLQSNNGVSHPTQKPVALMSWLVRMVTPPGGTVLDPFMGSGSTGVAATLEGFDFVGIEQDAEYAEIARRRIDHAGCQPALFTEGVG